MITGLNGRLYKDGKRIEAVSHPETRTKEEVRAARIGNQPKQPSGVPDVPVNPHEKTIAAEKARHNHLWASTDQGRRVLAELERKSQEWQAQQQAKVQRDAFALSIADLVKHAETSHQRVLDDPNASVADTEDSALRVTLAKQGKRDEYVVLDKAYRDKVLQRIAESAAAVESQRQTLAADRDAILAGGLDKPEPVPEVKPIELQQPVLIDRSRRAIVDSRTGKTTILSADDPSIAQ